ncbi:hypothetical protein [Thiorhodovibrio winogradskyi]|nr:hypothetical protein [Thiorhodovibrio winogradskyi]
MLAIACALTGVTGNLAKAEESPNTAAETKSTANTAINGTTAKNQQPDWIDTLQIHGFATQGLSATSANRLFGNSPDVSFKLRELGLNLSTRPTPDLLLSAQILSRTAGDVDNGDLRLDYGFLDYAFRQSFEDKWGLRLGRVKNPIGIYNETRDVDFTRPGILLPQSIYLDRARSILMSSDAAFLYGEQRLGPGTASLNMGYGTPQADDEELERSMLLGRDWAGHLRGEASRLGRILYQMDSGWLFGLTLGEARMDFNARGSDAPLLSDGAITLGYQLLSLQYERPDWSLTAEFLRQTKKTRGFGPLLEDGNTAGDNYYIQLIRRLSERLQLLLRYEEGYVDNADKQGKDAAAHSKLLQSLGLPGVARHNLYGIDWTLGLRWDPAPNWVVKTEYHRIKGTMWVPFTENPSIEAMEENWDLFLFTVGYWF